MVASLSKEGVLIQRPGKEPAQFQLSDIQKVWSGKVIFVTCNCTVLLSESLNLHE